MTSESGKAVVIALVVLALAVVGYVAYTQGYIGGSRDNTQDIEINLPGGNGGGSGY